MKEEIKQFAKVVAKAVESLVDASHADLGLFIASKQGSLGLFCGGSKEQMGDKLVPFLKEAVKRINLVIAESEQGKLELSEDGKNHLFYDKEEKKFVDFDQEADDGGFGFPG